MICAAIDIGSNSIHHVVVEVDSRHEFHVLARDKEVVRLGRSVARDGKLSANAIKRAVDCLKRFKQRAEQYGAEDLIAVATSATREAANRQEFLVRAAEDAGVHVELLSGTEEARLISLAASARYEKTLPVKERKRRRLLVIDIGGGSTELAIAQNREPIVLISFKLGAVRLTEQFRGQDPPSEKQVRRLRAEMREILRQRAQEIADVGFDDCYGTSGTINALGAMLLHNHSTHPAVFDVSLTELQPLNDRLMKMPLEERLQVPGLNRSRAEIIIAGGQLLEAIMEVMGVKRLTLCDWALREGVILSRLMRQGGSVTSSPEHLEKDPSLGGALALAQRYHADMNHAHRVAYLSQQMFDALIPLHRLGGEHRRLLTAAAILHDIGYLVSHTGHHKHSAYLIHHSELTGFMDSEIALIANIARYHRSSIPKMKHPFFAVLSEEERMVVCKLAAILRITDALDRDHQGRVRSLRCEIEDETVRLIVTSKQPSDAVEWRVEERSDLFTEIFGRHVVLSVV